MKFKEALTWLSQYEFHGIKPGLERISFLLNNLDNPQHLYPVVHIAGTNGKGSTAAFFESILRHHGLKTGLYTSPHLISVCERFVINGKPISEERFAELAKRVKKSLGDNPATYFELTTAIAFLVFAEEKVDIAIIECGLGGRLDATNVILPEVAIITPVSFDHQAFLGNTLSAIASEKVGIIKPERPVVTSYQKQEALEVIEKHAHEKRAPLFIQGRDFDIFPARETLSFKGKYIFYDLRPSLKGRHQLTNLALAIKATELLEEKGFLSLQSEKLKEAVANTSWPGRFEIISTEPPVILDGAHNLAGINTLKENLEELGIKEYILLFGASNEDGTKPFKEMLTTLLPGCKKLFICQPPGPRRPVSLEEWQVRLKNLKHPLVHFYSSWEKALEEALEDRKNLPLIVTGSLYLVGFARAYLNTLFGK
ncbi:bifunctional folylpolyglutamate synthase/dihydrofolate synthase [Thermodesulfatator autotrophicus]|uniref:Dihydrofolate synthase/folylpolyglutamate synthase n=1 Tax=Thermodesulfatator autotrophicus TaxID=1795632 RepID=A0A177EA55_9BACT|nr:folylpolyglutamate synthase/dihydrofolate synthase family protein [Thermodesulfatator autotrophicus]OAG28401.1 hypothetical protein TH606_02145 [Thermodesulfatator autotrophicus]